ncbi:Uncharacterised protein [Yersinia aldovae]|uniref:hypothetical protein n=1 Tax=Yersinia aldovae TaxID=29483 RepID=UPI0005E71864|nr:hypothetical protein [Yersinia aldovae]CNK00282.1 Uncharacterised protein [Yersinia aldovae]
MNVRERINFYNSLATSSPVIDQKNKVPDKRPEARFRLSEGIIKICGKYNFKPIMRNNNEDTNINTAAKKIQSYFRDHLEKLENMDSEGLRNKKGFIKTTYHGNKVDFHNIQFYHHKEHRSVHMPNKICDGTEKGSFKKLTRKDDLFVALEPTEKDDLFATTNNFKDIKGTHRVKPGLAVSTTLIIARNAGMCVFDYIQDEKKDPIPISAFENAANDLKILHKINTYLRDIKPENTAYDGKNINFIDVDDRVSDNARGKDPKVKFTLHGAPKIFTSAYITNNLKDKIYNNGFRLSNNENIVNYLKSADEYAFLLTIIATTTTSDVLRDNIINSVDTDISTDSSSSAGMSYSENRDELTTWVNKHVKPEHKSKVDLLLSAPNKHAELKDKIYLSDMLLFSGKNNHTIKIKGNYFE